MTSLILLLGEVQVPVKHVFFPNFFCRKIPLQLQQRTFYHYLQVHSVELSITTFKYIQVCREPTIYISLLDGYRQKLLKIESNLHSANNINVIDISADKSKNMDHLRHVISDDQVYTSSRYFWKATILKYRQIYT